MKTKYSPLISRRQALLGLGAFVLACETSGSVASGGDANASGDTTPDVPPAPPRSTLQDTLAIPELTPNRHHYVTSCCDNSELDGSAWELSFRDFVGCGDCEEPKALLGAITLAQLEDLTLEEREHTLECIGTGPSGQKIGNAVWGGRNLKDVFEAANVAVPAGATHLRFRSADGYTTGIPIEDLERPLWLAWRMNGEPLPPKHGYPARLLVPNRYGMKNPKWIVSIDFMDERHIGFWESRGWSDSAEYRVHTYIRYPVHQATLPPGDIRVNGVAYAGSDPVTKVEVTLDDGTTWADAAFDYAPGADRWVIWHYDLSAETGSLSIQARATTASGAMSDPKSSPKSDLGGYGGSHRITVSVAEA